MSIHRQTGIATDTGASSVATVGVVSSSIVPADVNRYGMIFQADPSNTARIWIQEANGAAAVVGQGYELNAGDSATYGPDDYVGEITAIAEAAGQKLAITKLT